MGKELTKNPPNERAILAKDDAYVEFAWNPSELGVRLTKGIRQTYIGWDRYNMVDMSKPDARQHWIAYKRLGYRRTSLNDI